MASIAGVDSQVGIGDSSHSISGLMHFCQGKQMLISGAICGQNCFVFNG